MAKKKKQHENENCKKKCCGKFSWCRDCDRHHKDRGVAERWDYQSYRKEYEEYLEEFYNG